MNKTITLLAIIIVSVCLLVKCFMAILVYKGDSMVAAAVKLDPFSENIENQIDKQKLDGRFIILWEDEIDIIGGSLFRKITQVPTIIYLALDVLFIIIYIYIYKRKRVQTRTLME